MAAPSSARHPCFSLDASHNFARVHLPVAPRCNLQCGYCDRRFSCVNESRPGVTASVVTPEEALEYLEQACSRLPNVAVMGIAGPGDPLANPVETLQTLKLVQAKFPHLLRCLSTNGLALPEWADELADLGVSHVTVTVNAVCPEIAAHIYFPHGMTLEQAASPLSGACPESDVEKLLLAQERGIRRLSSRGMQIKINTVVLPGINDAHVPVIAETVAGWGVDLMNCLPLLPLAGTLLAHLPEPDVQLMNTIRHQAERFLPQMRHCARCRADAAGLLAQPGKLSDYRPARTTLAISPQNKTRS